MLSDQSAVIGPAAAGCADEVAAFLWSSRGYVGSTDAARSVRNAGMSQDRAAGTGQPCVTPTTVSTDMASGSTPFGSRPWPTAGLCQAVELPYLR